MFVTVLRRAGILSSIAPSTLTKLQHFPLKHLPQPNHRALSSELAEAHKARTQWGIESLVATCELLRKQRNNQALEHILDADKRNGDTDLHLRADYFMRAIGLFTAARDFGSAITLVNLMMANRIPVADHVWIALLTGDELYEPRYREQILDMIAEADDNMINRAVRMRLAKMLHMKENPDVIERFYRKYLLERGQKDPLSEDMVGACGYVIAAFVNTGQVDHAKELLREYRLSRSCIPKPIRPVAVGERHFACYPYTAYIQRYRSSPTPNMSELNEIVSWMEEDNIIPDAEFCNATIDIMGRWDWYEAISPLYYAMYDYKKYPLPTPSTFRKMFVILTRVRPEQMWPTSPRLIFRHMLGMHQRFTGIGPIHFVNASTINAALSAICSQDDYAAIIPLFQTCAVFNVRLSKQTLDKLPQHFRRLIKIFGTKTPEDPRRLWLDRFLGSRTLDQCIHLVRTLTSGLPDSRLALYTKSMPRPQAEDVWVVMELACKALQARLGFAVDWDGLEGAVPETLQPTAEDILAERIITAFTTMVGVRQRHLYWGGEEASPDAAQQDDHLPGMVSSEDLKAVEGVAYKRDPLPGMVSSEDLKAVEGVAYERDPLPGMVVSSGDLKAVEGAAHDPGLSALTTGIEESERMSWEQRLADSRPPSDDYVGRVPSHASEYDLRWESDEGGEPAEEDRKVPEPAEARELMLKRLMALLDH